MDAGEIARFAKAFSPVPESESVAIAAEALLPMFRVPEALPAAVGENVTV